MSGSTSDHLSVLFTEIANRFRTERSQRLGQTNLRAEDFQALSAAGFLRLTVPTAMGGDWHNLSQTGPRLAEIVRCLARGDSSVALVAAMHPAVIAYWHPQSDTEQLTDQAKHTFATALDGHWWGTMMSEPGSGGDLQKTRALAKENGQNHAITGEKHFGSGSGQTSFMVTTARAADSGDVDLFVIDMRNRAWDGSDGLTLLREWDGHGMTGTQSHAFRLNDCRASRAESTLPFSRAIRQTSSLSGVLFAAVIVGILDEAFAQNLSKLAAKKNSMRPLEQVELVRARNEHWQAVTLYAAARDAMGQENGLNEARQAKYAIARLAESALGRLSKVVGGSSFGRTSPLGQWAQDVKALGFLRPPWALQNDQLFSALWDE